MANVLLTAQVFYNYVMVDNGWYWISNSNASYWKAQWTTLQITIQIPHIVVPTIYYTLYNPKTPVISDTTKTHLISTLYSDFYADTSAKMGQACAAWEGEFGVTLDEEEWEMINNRTDQVVDIWQFKRADIKWECAATKLARCYIKFSQPYLTFAGDVIRMWDLCSAFGGRAQRYLPSGRRSMTSPLRSLHFPSSSIHYNTFYTPHRFQSLNIRTR